MWQKKPSCPDNKDVFHQVHCGQRRMGKALHIISFDACKQPEKWLLAPQVSGLCAQAHEMIF